MHESFSLRNIRFCCRNRQDGFTYVELLVVVAIIVLMTSAIMVTYRDAVRAKDLIRASNQIAMDIRRMQSFALSAAALPNPIGPSATGVPPGGYGFVFGPRNPGWDRREYIIFADWNGDHRLFPASERIERKLLPGSATFHLIKGGPDNQVTALFCPPYATVLLYDEADTTRGNNCRSAVNQLDESVTLTISATSSPSPLPKDLKDIVFYASGAIDIQ